MRPADRGGGRLRHAEVTHLSGRHQLADLSKGRVAADGCLVCPWHGARYDTRTGAMVDGPQGILFYRGRTPGYSALVLAYAKHLGLRVGRVVRRAGRITVEKNR